MIEKSILLKKEEYLDQLASQAEMEITGYTISGLSEYQDREAARVKAIIIKHMKPLLELIK